MAGPFCCQHPKMTKPTKTNAAIPEAAKVPEIRAFWHRTTTSGRVENTPLGQDRPKNVLIRRSKNRSPSLHPKLAAFLTDQSAGRAALDGAGVRGPRFSGNGALTASGPGRAQPNEGGSKQG